jgi:hypothetical protein
MYSNRPMLLSLFLATAIAGCSKPADTAAPVASVPAASAEQPNPEVQAALAAASRESAKKACDLVTSAEMSAILGSAVVGAEPNHKSSGKTECIYKPAEAPSPYVEFSVEWGEGESAMNSMGAMAHATPGVADPYAGIGDQAVAVGTALMIRSGADLVTITFSGVTDAPAKAKKIFDTAKARM